MNAADKVKQAVKAQGLTGQAAAKAVKAEVQKVADRREDER